MGCYLLEERWVNLSLKTQCEFVELRSIIHILFSVCCDNNSNNNLKTNLDFFIKKIDLRVGLMSPLNSTNS